MISEKIVVNGIEYTVSSTTYRGLQQAKQSLMESIGKFEKIHPSQPIPQKEEAKEDIEILPEVKKTAPRKTTKKAK